MGDVDKLLSAPPKGVVPGVVMDGVEGVVTSPPRTTPPSEDDWGHVLEAFGLDPEKYSVEGPVRHSAWEVPGHGVQHAYRAKVVLRPQHNSDIEDLLDSIYLNPVNNVTRDGNWLTIVLSDTHIGKSAQAGAGTEYLIDRWKTGVIRALNHHENIGGVNLVFAGDLIEGYTSQDGKMIAECDLTLAEQLRTCQHLVSWTVQEILSRVDDLAVSVVPGNHGETTRKQSRPMSDNYDIMIVSAVQDAFSMVDPVMMVGKNVRWLYPDHTRGSVTYDCGGTVFTIVHGHLFKGQISGAEKWWSGHIANDSEEAQADILISGHFHNFHIESWTAKRWIVSAPALEKESTWFRNRTGSTSYGGVLSFITVDGVPRNINIF